MEATTCPYGQNQLLKNFMLIVLNILGDLLK